MSVLPGQAYYFSTPINTESLGCCESMLQEVDAEINAAMGQEPGCDTEVTEEMLNHLVDA